MNQPLNEPDRDDWPRTWCHACQQLQGIANVGEAVAEPSAGAGLAHHHVVLGCGHTRTSFLSEMHIARIRSRMPSL